VQFAFKKLACRYDHFLIAIETQGITDSYANVTVKLPCIVDETVFNLRGANNQVITTVVSRDNCKKPDTYCNSESKVCVPTKSISESCGEDRECQSVLLIPFSIQPEIDLFPRNQDNCDSNRVCATPPEQPIQIPMWQYAITSVCIIVGK
jgi:hypothetical protein